MVDNRVGILIITMLAGTFFAFLGWVSKTQNAGDMINLFDPKKHDKKKVSKIFGNHFLFIGIIILVIGILGIFFQSVNPEIFMVIQVGIIIVGLIKTIYAVEKHGKTDKK